MSKGAKQLLRDFTPQVTGCLRFLLIRWHPHVVVQPTWVPTASPTLQDGATITSGLMVLCATVQVWEMQSLVKSSPQTPGKTRVEESGLSNPQRRASIVRSLSKRVNAKQSSVTSQGECISKTHGPLITNKSLPKHTWLICEPSTACEINVSVMTIL